MQHPCALASQALLQACEDGACRDGPDNDECPRTPPDTLDEVELFIAAIIDSGMAGSLPELGPEDCLELCFTHEASKFAYQASAESEGHPADRP
eukprot:15457971-Alexandrium_andersonii.AAC.1